MFYLTDRFTLSVHTKGKKKVRASEMMFCCHLRKGYQLFYEKGAQTTQYVKTTQENYVQQVTYILVKS